VDEPTFWLGTLVKNGCYFLGEAKLQTCITFDWDIRFKKSLCRWNRNEKCYLMEASFLRYNIVTEGCFGNSENIDPCQSIHYLLEFILGWTLSHWLYSSNVIYIFDIHLRENFWYNNCPPNSAFMNIKRALNIAPLHSPVRISLCRFMS